MKNHLWQASNTGRNQGRLAAIMAAIMLAGFFGSSQLLKNNTHPRPGAEPQALLSNTTDSSRGDFHYFRSGQWLADLRTLVAACRYLLEPESA